MAFNSTKIFQKSFTTKDLFDIQLMRDDDNVPEYKFRHFLLITGAPDFKWDNATTLKVELDKAWALAQQIEYCCEGKAGNVCQYTIFTDPNAMKNQNITGEKKRIAVTLTSQNKISIQVKEGTTKGAGFSWTQAEAMSIAHFIKWLVNKGYELEFELRNNRVGYQKSSYNNSTSSQSNNNISKPTETAPFDDGDDQIEKFTPPPAIDDDEPFNV